MDGSQLIHNGKLIKIDLWVPLHTYYPNDICVVSMQTQFCVCTIFVYHLGSFQQIHWSKLAEWLRPTALRGANHRLTAADRADRAVETAEPPAAHALPAALVTAVPVAPAPVAALPPSDEPSKQQTRGVVLLTPGPPD